MQNEHAYRAIGTMGVVLVVIALALLPYREEPESSSLIIGILGVLLGVVGILGNYFQRPTGAAADLEGATGGESREVKDSHNTEKSHNTKDSHNTENSYNTNNSHNTKDSHNGRNSGLALVVVVALVVLAVVAALYLRDEQPATNQADEQPGEEGQEEDSAEPASEPNPNEATCDEPTPITRAGIDPRSATVVYTEGLGIVARCGPSVTYAKSDQQDLFDGVHVNVVCQIRDGYEVVDEANTTFPADYPRQSTVWNLIHDGRWVSDLYLSTPKVEGENPPEGYDLCDGLVLPPQ
ncbi:hypothetical protein [Nocardiopsis aegyptia]|uniref:Multisubunit Na+/H+ antiporter MnhB subunit n=1 Tax=Nocardiopsis aegyptia TaxID=220378 RepID=A0A7Z0J895_9ACTN|nr:hypothetical protein [Nocardiopsis aegyptia]NYJ32868.1 multisubunit Na+/H+ antiporter MnhB subunit [Nocardiopsis aegyptia]